MKPATIITLVTSDALQLDALLFGSTGAKIGYIFIHGLSSSAFSHNDILPGDHQRVSLYLNNRGHDEVTGIKRLKPDTEKGYVWLPGGAAHEVFEDCVHDIQAGVDYLKRLGAEKMYLVGHSTGCQKSVYYLAQTLKSNEVDGAVLICPMSDYAAAMHLEDRQKLAAATEYAQKMVKQGSAGSLLPDDVWPEVVDAQRFLSLYTPDSVEELFPYSQPSKTPELLKAVTVPLLVILAEKDEYADRPVTQIAQWFEKHAPANTTVKLLSDSMHNLNGKDEETLNIITSWTSSLK